ncbi:Sporulation related domain-containing protein [Cognatiyoonia koreensis]|uniref:Sporulation related domain-containing protein n=1 Tax=Cognatiyoonia koreensis TaxID=364200 RepID=A0A1I0NYG6_9RHOB|nr:SPOR domain-containing protein [Cognatiyoonia koreensis]SEW06166.1 Sporulation related domain-containing protein [Cognatiyoonia koreensis]
MAVYDDGIPVTSTSRLGLMTQYAGAAVSLALMVGIGVWGYKLVMRDVTGIPVVQAMEGDMRVAPENPGGEIARNTGLSVNEVSAEGEAGPMEDTLMLAPANIDLAQEDIEVQPVAEADEVVPVDPRAETAAAVDALLAALTDDPEPVVEGPLETDDILALADQIAAGASPLSDLAEGQDVPPSVALDGEAVTDSLTIISRDIPGVATSLRPFKRPASLVIPASATAPAATPTPAATPAVVQASVTTAPIPVGTKLVQLGAFPSPETAAQAWTNLQRDFGDYLDGKQQVIQEASSGGRTFYRLRAQGFAELTDARRFCAALEAGNAACIPVVVR